MRFFKCATLSGLLLAGLLSHIPAARATPLAVLANGGGAGMHRMNEGLIHKVSGCHHYRQYHLTYLWRYPVWHTHRRDCAPVPAEPPIDRGIIYRDGFGYYCHPEWRYHRHPRWGKQWHRHADRNCVVSRGWVWRGGPKAGCRKIGLSWICG